MTAGTLAAAPVAMAAPEPAQTGTTATEQQESQLVQAAADILPRCTSPTNPLFAGAMVPVVTTAVQASRAGIIGNFDTIAVGFYDRKTDTTCYYDENRKFASGSVVKATILGSLLRKAQIENRELTFDEDKWATAMITSSNNPAAAALFNHLGRDRIASFASLVGMNDTEIAADSGSLGTSKITARDQVALFKMFTADSDILNRKYRLMALDLLARVEPLLRFGVPVGAPPGTTAHVKVGYIKLDNDSEFNMRVHSVGSIDGASIFGCEYDYMMALLSEHNPDFWIPVVGATRLSGAATIINGGVATFGGCHRGGGGGDGGGGDGGGDGGGGDDGDGEIGPAPNLPPTVNAGPDVTGTEGAPVALHGSATDAESIPSVTWLYSPLHEVAPGTTCSFTDSHAPDTTLTCTDDGLFAATLTADDGVNPPVSDTALVSVGNAPPTLSLTGPQPWQVFRAGTPVDLTAPFTDPGQNDTHTCTVQWDDGSEDSYAANGRTCDRSHTFTKAGMYTIRVAVTDDDGASSTAEVMVVVFDPEAGFSTAGAYFDSPAGALTADPARTGGVHVQFNPQYQPGELGPAPGGGKVSVRYQDGDLDLDATSLEWLVVTPDGKAAVKGTGTVSGQAGYGFVLYGYDDPDRLRIVIWPLASGPNPGGTPTYDNRRDAGFDVDVAEPQPVSGGSIQIHS